MRWISMLAAVAAATALMAATPRPAAAVSPVGVVCTIGGVVSGLVGKACNAAQHAGRVLSAGKKLLGGHVGGALKALGGSAGTAAGSLATKATFAFGLAAIGDWIGGGAHAALGMVAGLVSRSTRPQLRSTWFSGTYWRVAALSALLTLPFLFAATVQALLRADITLLWRAALGYLPLALLAVAVVAPLTMLLLSAVDAMSSAVDAATNGAGAHFLDRMAGYGGVLTLLSHSPFLGCVLALLLVVATVVLWLELLIRDAAIYVVVLMLPLAFATLAWPARRVWVTRAVELLFALILSKFAIVAVLSLGGAALNSGGLFGAGKMSLGLVLVGLAATAPWMLMRLLPMAELAGSLHGMRGGHLAQHPLRALERGEQSHERAVERGGQDASPVPRADAARAELEKLVSGGTPGAGPMGADTEPAGPMGADTEPAAEPRPHDAPVPEPQDDGVRVAGFGDITKTEAPLSADVIRNLAGEGRPQLILGPAERGPAEPPPDPPPAFLDPAPPADGPAGDDSDFSARNDPAPRPPEDS